MLEAWLDCAGITEGPIFRPVLHNGKVLPAKLTDRSVALIIKRHVGHAGVNSIETMLRSHGNPKYWEMVVKTELNSDHPPRSWPVTVHPFPAHAPSSAM